MNPDKNKRLFISFSGGETSAFMAHWLMEYKADQYDDVVCLFANTGQENEETLEFVERCDKYLGLDVVWVEAEVNHGCRKGSSHKMVNFETASRSGEPFEEVIRKYGIPNKKYLHCTRELKLNPMLSYLRSIGWEKGGYDTAIGIRADEIDRIAADFRAKRLIYPLVSDVPTTKAHVNEFWAAQPFRLNLKSYEGNCKWCWKKSLRKHIHLIRLHPEWYDFPERMEREHGTSGHNLDGTPRTFFRENRSVSDIREIARLASVEPPEDESRQYTRQTTLPLDEPNGCSESCEVTF